MNFSCPVISALMIPCSKTKLTISNLNLDVSAEIEFGDLILAADFFDNSILLRSFENFLVYDLNFELLHCTTKKMTHDLYDCEFVSRSLNNLWVVVQKNRLYSYAVIHLHDITSNFVLEIYQWDPFSALTLISNELAFISTCEKLRHLEISIKGFVSRRNYKSSSDSEIELKYE